MPALLRQGTPAADRGAGAACCAARAKKARLALLCRPEEGIPLLPKATLFKNKRQRRHGSVQVLFEEMAKLMRYKPELEDYPTFIPYEEDAATYQVDPHSLDITLED